ncbi:hypothetical protein CK203_074541 [Vitis vinifera]|uniref:Retroviral polymerase SH3-like domain-containing protein n=1 Tax=Vitis vinifera TaxID=29760 RepID=A0A438ES04_VITVI|nr:hypothetical protein CK203_074541 [Vitis vinifera]
MPARPTGLAQGNDSAVVGYPGGCPHENTLSPKPLTAGEIFRRTFQRRLFRHRPHQEERLEEISNFLKSIGARKPPRAGHAHFYGRRLNLTRRRVRAREAFSIDAPPPPASPAADQHPYLPGSPIRALHVPLLGIFVSVSPPNSLPAKFRLLSLHPNPARALGSVLLPFCGSFPSITTTSDLPTVTLANGSQTMAKGIGLALPLPSLPLTSVLYTPECPFNLISISKITRTLNCSITFSDKFVTLQDRSTGKTIGIGRESQGLYHLTSDSSPAVCISTDAHLLIHNRLGHLVSPSSRRWFLVFPLVVASVTSFRQSHEVPLLGLFQASEGYRCYSLETHRYFISADVTFFEDSPFFSTTSKSLPVSEVLPIPIVSPPDAMPLDPFRLSSSPSCRCSSPFPEAPADSLPIPSASPASALPSPNDLPIAVRKSTHEALSHPGWRQAMVDEMTALHSNGTWDLVVLPSGDTFPCCQDCFCPLALSMAAMCSWPLYQLDIKNVFLHGDLAEKFIWSNLLVLLLRGVWFSVQTKDLGKLKYFLGIEIAQSSSGVVLSQGREPLGDPGDIDGSHWDVVIRILRYIKSTPGQGVLYENRGHTQVVGYTDADWAGSPTDRRSTSGYCVFIGELRFGKDEQMKLICDNQAALHIASNPVFHERTKHIEVDCHFIREKIASGCVATSLSIQMIN